MRIHFNGHRQLNSSDWMCVANGVILLIKLKIKVFTYRLHGYSFDIGYSGLTKLSSPNRRFLITISIYSITKNSYLYVIAQAPTYRIKECDTHGIESKQPMLTQSTTNTRNRLYIRNKQNFFKNSTYFVCYKH